MNSTTSELFELARRGDLDGLISRLASIKDLQPLLDRVFGLYTDALERVPNEDGEAEILYCSAKALDKVGKSKAAVDIYRMSADLVREILTLDNSESTWGYMDILVLSQERMGDLLQGAGNLREAREAYESAISSLILMAFGPQYPTAYKLLERVCGKTKRLCIQLGDENSAIQWESLLKRLTY